MKCEICNKAIKGDCQFINGAYYHNMCLEQVIVVYKIEQKVLTHTEKQLEMQLDKWERLKNWLYSRINTKEDYEKHAKIKEKLIVEDYVIKQAITYMEILEEE